jgi:hypothetical protein
MMNMGLLPKKDSLVFAIRGAWYSGAGQIWTVFVTVSHDRGALAGCLMTHAGLVRRISLGAA